jgi:sigma-E processing peptidase SpoIIGA
MSNPRHCFSIQPWNRFLISVPRLLLYYCNRRCQNNSKNPPTERQTFTLQGLYTVCNQDEKKVRTLVLYLDAVWMLNLLIDACLLKLTALMLKRNVGHLRFWSGALLASTVVLILFTPLAFLVAHPAGKLLFSALIILTTFGFGRFSSFFQNLAAFYFTAFAIGGGIFGLHYFFQNTSSYADGSLLSTMNYGDPVSWIFVIIGFPALWLFSKKRFDQTATRKWERSTVARITIRIVDQNIFTDALIDSGNKLYDPLTRVPVMFLSQTACDGVIPDWLFQPFLSENFQDLQEQIPDEWQGRISWIPYRSVDGVPRSLLAFRPDEVLVTYEDHTLRCKKVLVALTDQVLSPSGDFHSILHPDMLLHGKIIEKAS